VNARVSVGELLPSVEETLASIDVRTASVFIDGSWLNVLSVIRLSPAEYSDTKTTLSKVWNEHGAVKTEEFRIDCMAAAIEELAGIAAQLKEGKLRFPDSNFEVQFGRPVELDTAMGYIQTHHNVLWPESGWPTLEISLQPGSVSNAANNPQYRINSEGIQRAVSRLGYANTMDAISSLLEAKVGQGIINYDFYVALPVMAKISSASISPSEGLVEVAGSCHPALVSSLKIFGSSYAREEPKQRIVLQLDSDASLNPMRQFVAKGHIAASSIRELLELKLVHVEIGEVFTYSERTRDLLPEQYVNPLYFLLTKFCPPADLSKLICRPHSVPPQKTKPQKDFEQHVAWLLGCFGFSTIVLGAYEDLVAEQSRIKRGSVDILAYHSERRVVLFGGCTLNVPKEEDYVLLLSMRAMLLEDWKGDLPFSSEAVMFTAAPDCPAKWNAVKSDSFLSALSGDYVTVIDANRLSNALVLLQERKEDQFLQAFGTALEV